MSKICWMESPLLRAGCLSLFGLVAACQSQSSTRSIAKPTITTEGAAEIRILVSPTTLASENGRRWLQHTLLQQANAQQGSSSRALLRGFDTNEMSLVRRLLQQVGVPVERIQVVPPRVGVAAGGQILLRSNQSMAEHCPTTVQESSPYTIDSSDLMSAANCRQAANLSDMLATPSDLLTPTALAPLDAANLLGRDQGGDSPDAPKTSHSPSSDQQSATNSPEADDSE